MMETLSHRLQAFEEKHTTVEENRREISERKISEVRNRNQFLTEKFNEMNLRKTEDINRVY